MILECDFERRTDQRGIKRRELAFQRERREEREKSYFQDSEIHRRREWFTCVTFLSLSLKRRKKVGNRGGRGKSENPSLKISSIKREREKREREKGRGGR